MPTHSLQRKASLIVVVVLLIFLPFLEGDLRTYGYLFLLFSAGLTGFLSDWRKVKFDFIEIIFLLFLIIGAISSIFSEGRTRSLLELFRYTSYFLIFLNVRRLDELERKFIKKAYISAILVSSTILSIVAILLMLNITVIPYPSSGLNLYFANFGHNKLADLLLLAIPILYFLIYDLRDKLKNHYLIIFKILFLFLSISFVLTFSKSGYLVMIFIFVLMANFFSKKIVMNKFVSSKLILIPVVLIATAFIFVVLNTYFFHFREKPHYSVINKPLYLDWRWDYYRIALIGLKQSPMVGVGLDNFRYLSKMYQSQPLSWSESGENYYFTLFSDVGLIGGIIILILLFILFKKTINRSLSASNLLDMGITLALISSAIHSICSEDWQFLSVFLYFWMGAALLYPFNLKNSHSLGNLLLLRSISFVLILFSLMYTSGLFLFQYGKAINSKNLTNVSGILTFFDQNQQLQIGKWFKDKKNYQLALNYFGRSIRLEPKDYVSYIFTAEILEENKEFAQAINNYITAIKLDPLDSKSYFQAVYKLYLRKIESNLEKDNISGALETVRVTAKLFPTYTAKAGGAKLYQEAVKQSDKRNKEREKYYISEFVKKGRNLMHNIRISKEEIIQTLNYQFPATD